MLSFHDRSSKLVTLTASRYTLFSGLVYLTEFLTQISLFTIHFGWPWAHGDPHFYAGIKSMPTLLTSFRLLLLLPVFLSPQNLSPSVFLNEIHIKHTSIWQKIWEDCSKNFYKPMKTYLSVTRKMCLKSSETHYISTRGWQGCVETTTSYTPLARLVNTTSAL